MFQGVVGFGYRGIGSNFSDCFLDHSLSIGYVLAEMVHHHIHGYAGMFRVPTVIVRCQSQGRIGNFRFPCQFRLW